MTIFRSPYDTTACSGFILSKLATQLKIAFVRGEISGEAGVHEVRQDRPGADAVEAFRHPMLIDDVGKHREAAVFVDVRPFGSYDPSSGRWLARQPWEYALTMMRAQLSYIWANRDVSLLRDISPVPAKLFGMWLGNAVSHQYGLSPLERHQLIMLSTYFYYTLFFDGEEFDQRDKQRFVAMITRACGASAEDVFAMLEKIPPIKNLAGLAEAMKVMTGSIRLNDFALGSLVGVVLPTWQGLNSKEIVNVALEHPPTWISILVAAIMEKNYKNSAIGRLVDAQRKKGDYDNLVRAIQHLIQSSQK